MPAALADTSQIICEVWASNVDEEMRKIRQIVQNYNYIAMVGIFVLSSEAQRDRVRYRTARYEARDLIRPLNRAFVEGRLSFFAGNKRSI